MPFLCSVPLLFSSSLSALFYCSLILVEVGECLKLMPELEQKLFAAALHSVSTLAPPTLTHYRECMYFDKILPLEKKIYEHLYVCAAFR